MSNSLIVRNSTGGGTRMISKDQVALTNEDASKEMEKSFNK